MNTNDIANMVGQEIVKDNGDAIDVKYKNSWGSTYMGKNEYYLQLITGCGEFGKWFDMNYLYEVLSFLIYKGIILWLTPLIGFVTKFYIQDKNIKAYICAAIAFIWIFVALSLLYEYFGSALERIQMPTIMFLAILFFTQASVIMYMKAGQIVMIRHICRGVCKFSVVLLIIGLVQAIIWTVGSIIIDIINSYRCKKRNKKK